MDYRLAMTPIQPFFNHDHAPPPLSRNFLPLFRLRPLLPRLYLPPQLTNC